VLCTCNCHRLLQLTAGTIAVKEGQFVTMWFVLSREEAIVPCYCAALHWSVLLHVLWKGSCMHLYPHDSYCKLGRDLAATECCLLHAMRFCLRVVTQDLRDKSLPPSLNRTLTRASHSN
jgi:hypothetical protein